MTRKSPPLRILVADDSPSIRQILLALLGRQGHQVFAAEDGQQALDLFQRHQPDLLLLDIMMPVLDGMEVARRIRAEKLDRWVPIIFLSALDRRENLVAGLEAGGDDFLAKPLDFALLDARIRSMHKALDLQRQARESYRQLKAISDNVLDAIVTIDIHGRILSCNQATERILGWRPEELRGQNVNVLMPEPYHSRHNDYMRAYVEGGPPNVFGYGRERPALRKDGTIFPAELAVTEIRDGSQRIFIGLLRDVTERKNAEMKLMENAAALQQYYDQAEEENQLAARLLDKQMLRPGLQDSHVRYWLSAAKNFSGDVVAATRTPDGSLVALLADATGHGLTAAISTLPLLTVFYGMANRGLPLESMVGEMNRHLKASLPTGHFVAANVVLLDPAAGTGQAWCGGMPETLLLDVNGEIVRTFASRHLPFGILGAEEFEASIDTFQCAPGHQLMLYSDGFKEAEGKNGAQLGHAGLREILRGIPPEQRLSALQQALAEHLAGNPAQDDISVLLLDC